jgi:hypothetical protein
MYSERLTKELGLLSLVSKTAINSTNIEANHEIIETTQTSETEAKLDKSEFRLLVKMLQAIKVECQYDQIEYDGNVVNYHLPKTTLVFNNIDLPDDAQTINLSSLTDLLQKPELKRPVWEKLKTL